MVIARKIAYNVVINVITKVFSTVLALVGIGLITRYLGTEGFGQYATVLAFFAFFSAFADLGLYAIATREISREGANEEKVLGSVMGLRITSAALVVLFSPFLAALLPYPYHVKIGIVLAALSFGFSSTYLVLNGLFQKNLAMDRVGIAEVLGKVLQIAGLFAAVRLDLGFDAVVGAMVFALAFNCLTVVLLSRRYVRIKLDFDTKKWRCFLKESLPMGISVLVTFAYFKLDTIILSILKESADVGVYNAAYKVIENLTFFPSMIIGLVFPMMSRYVFSNAKRFGELLDETLRVFVILAVPMVIGTLFLADEIIAIIGGSQFAASAGVLRILIFSLAAIFFGNFFNNILVAAGKQTLLMRILAVCAIFNISANLILIPKFSYLGAAATSVATETLVVILTSIAALKTTTYRPRLGRAWAIALSGLALAFFLAISPSRNTLVLVAGGALIYTTFLWLTRAITASEILSIVRTSKTKNAPLEI